MADDNQNEAQKKTQIKELFKGGRISNIMGIFILATAFFIFDVPQIFLEWIGIGFFINWIITIFAAMTFWLWFTLHNVSFTKPSKLFTYLAALGIDLIPGTDASVILAFTWTVGTFIILMITRIEDVTGITLPKNQKNINPVKK